MATVSPSPPVAELQAASAAHADASKRDWWIRYLKGAAEFRMSPEARKQARGRHRSGGRLPACPPDQTMRSGRTSSSNSSSVT